LFRERPAPAIQFIPQKQGCKWPRKNHLAEQRAKGHAGWRRFATNPIDPKGVGHPNKRPRSNTLPHPLPLSRRVQRERGVITKRGCRSPMTAHAEQWHPDRLAPIYRDFFANFGEVDNVVFGRENAVMNYRPSAVESS
jgi:hypothetical protein